MKVQARIDIMQETQKLLLEVKQNNVRNAYAVTSHFDLIFPDLDAYMAAVHMEGVALDEINYSLERMDIDESINDYLFVARRNYEIIHRTTNVPEALKKDKTRDTDYEELSVWLAAQNDEAFFTANQSATNVGQSELQEKLSNRKDLRSKETLKESELKKLSGLRDLRSLLTGILKGYGYTGPEIDTVKQG